MQVCRKHNCKAAKHPWSYMRILSPPVTHLSKPECSHPQLDVACRCPCRGGIHLEAALQPREVTLPFGPGSRSILYPLQGHVYQDQSQPSPVPHPWNALIIQASRQFLLQFPPGVLILGQITLPINWVCVCRTDFVTPLFTCALFVFCI